MDKIRITVMGGGNAGYAMSSFLTHIGHKVKLYKKSLDKEIRNKKINITGIFNFTCEIELITNNLSEAIKDADLVIVTVPGFCQSDFFDELIKNINKNIYTILMPDNYGGFLLDEKLKQNGINDYKKILSLNTSLFACRQHDNNEVSIKGIKKEVKVSSINEEVVEEGLRILNDIHPVFKKGINIFEVCLSNMNPMVHIATTLLNIGWIERTMGNFDFYGDGITLSVARVIEQIDKERIEIGKMMGLDLDSLLVSMQKIYGSKDNDLQKSLSTSCVHSENLAPTSLNTRYIDEDIPYGLIPLSKIGKILGIKTEAIDTMITLGGIATGKIFNEFALKDFEKNIFSYLIK